MECRSWHRLFANTYYDDLVIKAPEAWVQEFYLDSTPALTKNNSESYVVVTTLSNSIVNPFCFLFYNRCPGYLLCPASNSKTWTLPTIMPSVRHLADLPINCNPLCPVKEAINTIYVPGDAHLERCTLDILDDNVTAMTNHLYRDFSATSMHENALSTNDHGTPDEYSTVKKTTFQNLWPRINSN